MWQAKNSGDSSSAWGGRVAVDAQRLRQRLRLRLRLRHDLSEEAEVGLRLRLQVAPVPPHLRPIPTEEREEH